MSLRHGDLHNSVFNYVSIDEYKPKAGSEDEIVVIGFYAMDKEPAKDLNTFIQRGAIDVIDTEVSPNPDEFGRYLIFVELKDDEEIVEKTMSLLRDINNVCAYKSWYVANDGSATDVTIDEETLAEQLMIEYVTDKAFADDDTQAEAHPETSSTDKPSDTDEAPSDEESDDTDTVAKVVEYIDGDISVDFDDQGGMIIGEGYKMFATFVDFGDQDVLLSENTVEFNESSECSALQKMLGNNWEVCPLSENKVAVQKFDTDKILLLQGLTRYYGKSRHDSM